MFQPPLPPSISDGFDICEEGVLLEQPDVIEDPALTLVSVTDEEGDQNDVNADDNAGGDDDGEDNEEHE